MTTPNESATPNVEIVPEIVVTLEATPAVEPEVKPEAEDELPEWARQKLTKANAEAANYRTRLREAEAKLAEAKTPEEFAAAVTDLSVKNKELERGLVATKFNLPPELANLLQGDDEAALTEHAKSLQKVLIAAKGPAALSGGLTPGENEADELDPRKLARASRRFS